jgi:hypothetical protein
MGCRYSLRASEEHDRDDLVLPLSAANYPAVIDQFDSDVDSFQFGYVFALVFGAIVSDGGATIRIRNHYHSVSPHDRRKGFDRVRRSRP